MTDNKNMIVAVVLSLLVLVAFQFLYEKPRQVQRQAEMARQQSLVENNASPSSNAAAPATPVSSSLEPAMPQTEATRPRAELVAAGLAAGTRLRIDTPRVDGTINLIGGRLDDLSLINYHETVDPKSPEIVVLAPLGTTSPYYADFGWLCDDQSLKLPGADTRWSAAGSEPLTPQKPVTLTWDNGQGLIFVRNITVDENYLFTVTQSIRSTLDHAVKLYPYGLVSRHGTPATISSTLHEGGIGVLDGNLQEITYKQMREKPEEHDNSTGGWMGITDDYWLVAMIPEQTTAITARFAHDRHGDQDIYQADYREAAITLVPQSSVMVTDRLFAGAKVVHLLDHYEDELGVPHLDKAVNFGRLYIIAKPLFYAVDFFGTTLGNFGLGILAFTVMLRLLLYPLANKSFVSMSKMKLLQPEIAALKEKHGDDRAKMSQELMELYKKNNANPLSGCLPILVQIPIFFALNRVLYVTIEMWHAPFYGWIKDLSAQDPTSIINLFGLLPYAPPAFLPGWLNIGILPIIMGLTMVLQQRMNPPPADPTQAKMMTFMPIFITFTLARFPAGLVIYWAWNNTLSVLQQFYIQRRVKAATA